MYSLEWAAPAAPYVLYDGTNSADVLAAVQAHYVNDSPPPAIVSETDGVLTISEELDGPFVVSVGERLGVPGPVVSAADWATKYVKA